MDPPASNNNNNILIFHPKVTITNIYKEFISLHIN